MCLVLQNSTERVMAEMSSEILTSVSLGDVAQLSKVRSRDAVARYVGLEHLSPGDLKIRTWGDVADGTTFTNRFAPGQVLFGKRRPYQRKVAVADFDGVCSGDIYVIESKGDLLLPALLPFILQSDTFIEHAVRTSAGSLSPRTNWKSLAEFKLDIPPRGQQERAAELLLAASDSLSCLSELTEAANAARRAMSVAAFESVVSDGLSGSKRLGEILSHVVDRGYEGLPVLSVTIDGRVVRRESLGRHVSDETGDAKYLRVLPGDLAYNTMRLWQGSVGVVEEAGLVSPAYTVLRIQDDSYTPEFLLALFRSPAMQRVYRRYVTGVASDRWRLYFRDLSEIRVSMPADDQMMRLLSDLGVVDQANHAVQSRLADAQSVLSAARHAALGV